MLLHKWNFTFRNHHGSFGCTDDCCDDLVAIFSKYFTERVKHTYDNTTIPRGVGRNFSEGVVLKKSNFFLNYEPVRLSHGNRLDH